MENIVFTQLSIPELRKLFRQELEGYFNLHTLSPVSNVSQAQTDDLGSIILAQEITWLARPSIYNLISQNKIPHFKQGKRLYFSRNDLTEWIKSGKRKTLAEIAKEADAYTSNKKKGLNNG